MFFTLTPQAILFFTLCGILLYLLTRFFPEIREFYHNRVKWQTNISREQYYRYDKTLSAYLPYYRRLSIEGKARFIHRLIETMVEKEFVGRNKLEVTEEMRVVVFTSRNTDSIYRKVIFRFQNVRFRFRNVMFSLQNVMISLQNVITSLQYVMHRFRNTMSNLQNESVRKLEIVRKNLEIFVKTLNLSSRLFSHSCNFLNKFAPSLFSSAFFQNHLVSSPENISANFSVCSQTFSFCEEKQQHSFSFFFFSFCIPFSVNLKFPLFSDSFAP